MTEKNKIETSLFKLMNYCERQEFKGWDPYDGLNSKIFKALPFIKNLRIARLAWIQFFKRFPYNLRKLFLIDKGYNPKGLGLFLNGYCNLYKVTQKDEYIEKIDDLASKIIQLISSGYSGACWGYNFDWQSRAFFQPAYTPTVVATTFIGYALLDAYDITGNEKYLETSLSIADFILKDLNRTYDNNGNFSFSYSPLDHSQVINASLLGSRMLSRLFNYVQDEKLIREAKKSVEFCCNWQNEDGSWPYGCYPYQNWVDNFHTGYNLECLSEYQKYSNDHSYTEHLNKGLDYYLRTFFTADGKSKYFNNSLYPIDIHSPSQCIITLSKLNKLKTENELVQKVLDWTITNMQSKKGFFYYQLKNRYTVKIPYIRWSQAWMFYALSEYSKFISGHK